MYVIGSGGGIEHMSIPTSCFVVERIPKSINQQKSNAAAATAVYIDISDSR